MSNSSPERNKAIVLEAFETLFNKRDYAAAERFWSPNYIQQGPPPGSPPTLSGSKTVFLKSIGTFCRTRRPRPNLSAAFPCSATPSQSDS